MRAGQYAFLRRITIHESLWHGCQRLEITGTSLPPVVKITDEATGELVYAIRAKGYKFRPKVFAKGVYKIEAGEPNTQQWKVLTNISSIDEKVSRTIRIDL